MVRDGRGISRRVRRVALAIVAGGLLAPAIAGAEYEFESAFGVNGNAEGGFGIPTGLTVKETGGDVFVTDSSLHRVQKFTAAGTFTLAWGWGVDTGGSSYQLCTATCQSGAAGASQGQMNAPDGIAVHDSSGAVYVADVVNHRIGRFGAAGALLTPMGASGTAEGQFSFPRGVAVDQTTGDLYVVDSSNQRIQVFDSSGTFLRAWGWGVDDGAAALQTCTSGCQAGTVGSQDGRFSTPEGIALNDAGDRVYVADTNNHRVQEFTTGGTFVDAWGSGGTAEGQFQFPDGIDVDSDGSVLVSDNNNHRVQKFTDDGEFVATWGWGVDDGSAALQTCTIGCQAGVTPGNANGQLHFAGSLALAPNGDVYVADRNNDRVQLFEAVEPQTTPVGPDGQTSSDTTPTLQFTSDVPDSTFECRVVPDAFAPCNDSNATVGAETNGAFTPAVALGEGTHTLEVVATDRTALTDPTPAVLNFNIDSLPPSVNDLDVAVNDRKRKAKATFEVDDELPGGIAGVECKLDGKDYAPCESPQVYKKLKPGKHKVRVRVTDFAANTTVAKQGFKVKK
jgi:DNA-binding beta-propeller fold protein YncE